MLRFNPVQFNPVQVSPGQFNLVQFNLVLNLAQLSLVLLSPVQVKQVQAVPNLQQTTRLRKDAHLIATIHDGKGSVAQVGSPLWIDARLSLSISRTL